MGLTMGMSETEGPSRPLDALIAGHGHGQERAVADVLRILKELHDASECLRGRAALRRAGGRIRQELFDPGGKGPWGLRDRGE
jgi:hypothetical protein